MAAIWLVVTMAALGLPGLNSFVGEFMTLLGAWQLSPWLAGAASIGLILAPVYMLRLFQGLMYAGPGEQERPPRQPAVDLHGAEVALLAPLVILMFVLGLYPGGLLHLMSSLGFPLPIPWR